MNELERLQQSLDYQFEDESLLQAALTHRSYSRHHNNERLEFLGDSVLGLVISTDLYTRLDKASEGELSRVRASLVKEDTLARVARDLNLGDCLRLGGGELKSGGFRRSSILSDAMEAIIGAIYLDAGYERCRKSVMHLYRSYLKDLPASGALKDPKTRLQEFLQSRQIDLPSYQVIKTEGKSHEQTFTVQCNIQALNLNTTGKGKSRKKAEQIAAAEALLRVDDE